MLSQQEPRAKSSTHHTPGTMTPVPGTREPPKTGRREQEAQTGSQADVEGSRGEADGRPKSQAMQQQLKAVTTGKESAFQVFLQQ